MATPRPLTLADFDFDLPPHLIAQSPSAERTGSRLLQVTREEFADTHFRELPSLLRPGDLLVLNDTRVIRSRLAGYKTSGGAVELLLERVLDPGEALFQLRVSHAPRPGQELLLPGEARARVIERRGRFFRLGLVEGDWITYLDRFGTVPLPPYIRRSADERDDLRYQTVYSRSPGAVAAPTAGLHFDQSLLDRLAAADVSRAWVTLHVGAGTFQPVQSENISRHQMHAERYFLPQETVDAIKATRRQGGRVVAVGTTSLRALEAAAEIDGVLRAGSAETSIFITPGFRFRVVDCLITNFHLPRSTLLMLVAAYAGLERIHRAYAHAIAAEYRFFSYGDAMFLEPKAGVRIHLPER